MEIIYRQYPSWQRSVLAIDLSVFLKNPWAGSNTSLIILRDSLVPSWFIPKIILCTSRIMYLLLYNVMVSFWCFLVLVLIWDTPIYTSIPSVIKSNFSVSRLPIWPLTEFNLMSLMLLCWAATGKDCSNLQDLILNYSRDPSVKKQIWIYCWIWVKYLKLCIACRVFPFLFKRWYQNK